MSDTPDSPKPALPPGAKPGDPPEVIAIAAYAKILEETRDEYALRNAEAIYEALIDTRNNLTKARAIAKAHGWDNESEYESVLRYFAFTLGMGGYNSPHISAKRLEEKIKAGMDHAIKMALEIGADRGRAQGRREGVEACIAALRLDSEREKAYDDQEKSLGQSHAANTLRVLDEDNDLFPSLDDPAPASEPEAAASEPADARGGGDTESSDHIGSGDNALASNGDNIVSIGCADDGLPKGVAVKPRGEWENARKDF